MSRQVADHDVLSRLEVDLEIRGGTRIDVLHLVDGLDALALLVDDDDPVLVLFGRELVRREVRLEHDELMSRRTVVLDLERHLARRGAARPNSILKSPRVALTLLHLRRRQPRAPRPRPRTGTASESVRVASGVFSAHPKAMSAADRCGHS
jgi:hypothetical protein